MATSIQPTSDSNPDEGNTNKSTQTQDNSKGKSNDQLPLEEERVAVQRYSWPRILKKWRDNDVSFKSVDTGEVHDFSMPGFATLSADTPLINPLKNGSHDMMCGNKRLMTFHKDDAGVITPTYYEPAHEMVAMRNLVRLYKISGRRNLTLEYSGLDYSKRSDPSHKLQTGQVIKLLEMAVKEGVSIKFGNDLNNYVLAMKDSDKRDKILAAMRLTNANIDPEFKRLETREVYTGMTVKLENKIKSVDQILRSIAKDDSSEVVNAKIKSLDTLHDGLCEHLKIFNSAIEKHSIEKINTPINDSSSAHHKFIETLYTKLNTLKRHTDNIKYGLAEANINHPIRINKDKVASINETLADSNNNVSKLINKILATHSIPQIIIQQPLVTTLEEQLISLKSAINAVHDSTNPEDRNNRLNQVEIATNTLDKHLKEIIAIKNTHGLDRIDFSSNEMNTGDNSSPQRGQLHEQLHAKLTEITPLIAAINSLLKPSSPLEEVPNMLVSIKKTLMIADKITNELTDMNKKDELVTGEIQTPARPR